jgi:FtsZ-binding cell division protein ZapB
VPLLVEAVKEIDRRLDQRVGDEQQERQQLSKKIEQLQAAGANRSADCACESKVASLEQKVGAQAAELTELKEEQQRMREGQQAAMADATRLMQEQVQKQVQEQLKQALGHLRDDIFGESKA